MILLTYTIPDTEWFEFMSSTEYIFDQFMFKKYSDYGVIGAKSLYKNYAVLEFGTEENKTMFILKYV